MSHCSVIGSDPVITDFSFAHLAQSKLISYDSIISKFFFAIAFAFVDISYLSVIGQMRLFVVPI